MELIRPDILNQRSRDFRRQLKYGVDQANARDDICCGRSRADRPLFVGYQGVGCSAIASKRASSSVERTIGLVSMGSWTGARYQQLLYDASGNVTAIGGSISGGLSGGAGWVVTPKIRNNQTGVLLGSYVAAIASPRNPQFRTQFQEPFC